MTAQARVKRTAIWQAVLRPVVRIQSHLQARKIAKEVGNRVGEPVILGALGGCFTALGRNSQAIACHQEQLSIAQSMTEGLVVVKGSRYLGTAWVEIIDLVC